MAQSSCIFRSSHRSAASTSYFPLFNPSSCVFKSAFFDSSRRSFISLSTLLSCLSLSFRALTSSLSFSFLYNGDDNHVPQLFFCASAATSAATILFRFSISCSNRPISLCSSRIDEPMVLALVCHRALRSRFNLWVSTICSAYRSVSDCGVEGGGGCGVFVF